jgi:phosphoribosylanthranilate isomerase
MTKVKICGITNYDDASVAVDLGADALGFIFAPSPRNIAPEKAGEIIRKLPPFIKSVGVFVNEDTEKIRDIVRYCGLDNVQLHGDETPEICDILMPRAIKALKIKGKYNSEQYEPYKGKVRAFLLDTFSEKTAGGTGRTFDWNEALNIKKLGVPVILAGGLNPSNILEAIERVKPYAVDVNSGIEERPGKKDHSLMKKLFGILRWKELENSKE